MSSCSQLFLSNWQRIQYFGSKTVLAIIAKQSVTFLLELNHNTLTIWYQIDQCHFPYTAESLVWYLKLCGLLTQSVIFSTSYHYCRLMEGKLSMGLFSSISFNDNAIVRNFYPKKFQSLKLFKDLLPTWRELITFDYRTALDLLSRMSFWLQRNWGKKNKRYWSFSLLLSRENWPKSCERKSLRTHGLYYSPDGVQGGYLCQRKYYWFSYFFPIF